MKQLISCCGIDCSQCEARIATLKNDDILRAEVAAKWSEMYQSPDILANTINCTGCRMEGVKFTHCETTCEIRKCVIGKGYNTCGDCAELNSCKIVNWVLQAVPDAKSNLLSLTL